MYSQLWYRLVLVKLWYRRGSTVGPSTPKMIVDNGYLKFNGYNTISMLFGPLNEKKVEKSKPEKKNYHPSSGGLVFSSKH